MTPATEPFTVSKHHPINPSGSTDLGQGCDVGLDQLPVVLNLSEQQGSSVVSAVRVSSRHLLLEVALDDLKLLLGGEAFGFQGLV